MPNNVCIVDLIKNESLYNVDFYLVISDDFWWSIVLSLGLKDMIANFSNVMDPLIKEVESVQDSISVSHDSVSLVTPFL